NYPRGSAEHARTLMNLQNNEAGRQVRTAFTHTRTHTHTHTHTHSHTHTHTDTHTHTHTHTHTYTHTHTHTHLWRHSFHFEPFVVIVMETDLPSASTGSHERASCPSCFCFNPQWPETHTPHTQAHTQAHTPHTHTTHTHTHTQ